MQRTLALTTITAAVSIAGSVSASSHREAPFIAGLPQVDNTDLYAFNSYEAGREGYVTIIANYIPFQDPYGGPNFYPLDESARYAINIDNNGDAVADIRFRFTFAHEYKNVALPIGDKQVPIPLINAGPVGPEGTATAALNRVDSYKFDVIWNQDRLPATHADATDGDEEVFIQPVDNIGNKSLADYAAYAADHIYDVTVPGCPEGSRVFVGQRKEGFVINVGEIFDLINLDPLGAPDAEENTLAGKNVTTIALELPAECLAPREPVIGVWATASKRQMRTLASNERAQENGGFVQVSRVGQALVNEVVIGLPDKDLFNQVAPSQDSRFLAYVTNPTLPALIETLFPAAKAPTVFPRQDLVDVFLKGVEGLNRPTTVVPAEMLRLNTKTPAVAAAQQNPLGVIAKDLAGYPNGRRPGDDVVDISLRVAMGVLLPANQAPAGQLPFTDGAYIDATQFDDEFPYLLTPLPGSPNEADGSDPTDEEDGSPATSTP